MPIKTDSNGNQYVDVDLTTDIQRILREAGSANERAKIVYRYVMDNLRGKYPTSDGREVSVIKRSAKELSHGTYEDKFRAIPELANIIEAGTFKGVTDAKHRLFKKFAYYEVSLKIGARYYTATVNIGITESGESVLYQINRFKEIAGTVNSPGVRVPAPVDGPAIIDNISDSAPKSKKKNKNLSGEANLDPFADA
ncbi:hypothetical protein R80B4_02247 [Fibrobacteres bacterium R8-0-B4]